MTWSEIALFILAIHLFALGGLALVVTVMRIGEKSFRRVALPGLVAVAGLGLAVASAYTYEYLGDRRAGRTVITAGGEEDPDGPALNREAARLAGILKSASTSGERWTELGRIRRHPRQFTLAARAFGKAIENGIDTADAHLAYGGALVAANGDRVTEAARLVFQKALKRDKALPGARYYIALHAYQKNHMKEAHDGFVALGQASRADDPWMPLVRRAIDRIALEAGLPNARAALRSPVAKDRAVTAQPGPTREEMAAAGAMTPAARQSMIESMVARLAARMREDPRDFTGWLRLAPVM